MISRCLAPGCVKQTAAHFCLLHTCDRFGCTSFAVTETFCPSHCCWVDGCVSEAFYGGLCSAHAAPPIPMSKELDFAEPSTNFIFCYCFVCWDDSRELFKVSGFDLCGVCDSKIQSVRGGYLDLDDPYEGAADSAVRHRATHVLSTLDHYQASQLPVEPVLRLAPPPDEDFFGYLA